jgi:hypothetical protein
MPQEVQPEKPMAKSTTMAASSLTVVASAVGVAAQMSGDIAKIREGLGLNATTFALIAAVVTVVTGGYLIWKRVQGRNQGRV